MVSTGSFVHDLSRHNSQERLALLHVTLYVPSIFFGQIKHFNLEGKKKSSLICLQRKQSEKLSTEFFVEKMSGIIT